ncbi:hypothetical protein WCSV-1gp1 [Water chestnut soymovirus 1]|uniref:Uncharacterized protein n=1 Tax=Water chestnut soymovirus 1 TaxID=1848040 RepID=A0A172PC83_9VIRU|nr:hypothetical protein WCSV-1gp1 [Water chestnut soymovirus 1]AND65748.1 hypothetical protein WCSV-1gp1 [Water chestnut soymovirus 1]
MEDLNNDEFFLEELLQEPIENGLIHLNKEVPYRNPSKEKTEIIRKVNDKIRTKQIGEWFENIMLDQWNEILVSKQPHQILVSEHPFLVSEPSNYSGNENIDLTCKENLGKVLNKRDIDITLKEYKKNLKIKKIRNE